MARQKTRGACHLWWCKKPAYALDLCLKHYRAQQRGGGVVKLSWDAIKLLAWIDQVIPLLRQVSAGEQVDKAAVDELLNQL